MPCSPRNSTVASTSGPGGSSPPSPSAPRIRASSAAAVQLLGGQGALGECPGRALPGGTCHGPARPVSRPAGAVLALARALLVRQRGPGSLPRSAGGRQAQQLGEPFLGREGLGGAPLGVVRTLGRGGGVRRAGRRQLRAGL